MSYDDENRGRSHDRRHDHDNGNYNNFHFNYENDNNHNNHHHEAAEKRREDSGRKTNGVKTYRKRVRRWDDPAKTINVVVPGVPYHLPNDIPPELLHALIVRIRIDEITQKLVNPAGGLEADILHNTNNEDRSPSPPPIYDQYGKRLNTRDVEFREKLQRERQKLIEFATKLYPHFRPPMDYRPLFNKKYRKIFIPVQKYPDQNFIGLIIGPRGTTQKSMEKETNCKIAIRGRGSMKDGKTYSKGNKIDPKISSDDEDIHVLITGDTEEDVEKAADMVSKLLVPMDESKNEHKRMQLRLLAEMNGTLRENNIWTERERFEKRQGPEIVCSICGDGSHPSYDCPTKWQAKKKLDNEYESFLSEIGDSKADEDYEEFMRSIEDPSAPAPPPPPPSSTPPWLKQSSHSAPPPPWANQPPPPPPPAHASQQGYHQADYSQSAYQYGDYNQVPPPPSVMGHDSYNSRSSDRSRSKRGFSEVDDS